MLALALVSLALFVLVSAHPGEIHERMNQKELARRQLASHKRHAEASNCAAQVAAYQSKRKAKRSNLRKRADESDQPAEQAAGALSAVASVLSSFVSKTASASPPHFTSIQNFTCVTAPEVTEGPYYINNEMVRQDLTEDLRGVKLILDIGVLDTTTCKPLENILIELWSANATGVYSSYGSLGGKPGPPPPGSPPPREPPKGPGRGGDGPRHSPPMTRNETFLRGGWHTDANGIVELTTIFPGFYAGRAPHIHAMVHKDWVMADNGTLISHAGTIVHNGQFFFHEGWNDRVFAHPPYTSNHNKRTLNKDDHILWEENADGNNAFLDLELLGDMISDGILGYITLGVNSSASYEIQNTNYLSPAKEATNIGIFDYLVDSFRSTSCHVFTVIDFVKYTVQRVWTITMVRMGGGGV
jgi:protocatechuate 3,4-dioxygenase beta subunit